MTKRTKEILDRLDAVYTREYKCYLNHENPGQLLIATMLSAQCIYRCQGKRGDQGFVCKISQYEGIRRGRFGRVRAGY